ncbi:MAG TPA: sigma-70 family RNA polymerase sigma factor [Saprospiraceae bacterium]|nr:sigma-70 family RNA polymerase sigma factor [Saprospiraceae bacterium]HMQ83544.1 sigma-70 family RNA polymerase sigma factor [Saprospiraceae bacterium]
MNSKSPALFNNPSELLSQLRQGNQEALGYLYEKYSGALLAVILRKIPAKEMAEEVLQDVFVKIWQKIDQYDENKGKLFTWMMQITRNTTIDALRSGYFKAAQKTDSSETIVDKDILGQTTAKVDDVGLKKVIHLLEESHQVLIDYIYFQDYTYSETSEALNMPIGTVKTRMRQAILRLRQILQNETFLLFIFWLCQ